MTTVTVQTRRTVVVVQDRRPIVDARPQVQRTLQARPNARIEVVVQDRRPTVDARPQVREVVQVGIAGPRGPIGPSGAALPAVQFAYGDATPAPLLALPAGGLYEVVLCSLQIETPFDGAGATIALGIEGQPGLLMAVDQNAPAAPVTFETTPRVELPGGTAVILSLNPGAGATQGVGEFVLQVAPIS